MTDAPSGRRIMQAIAAYQAARERMLAEDPDAADAGEPIGIEAEDVDAILSRLLALEQWTSAQANAVKEMIGDLDTRRHRFVKQKEHARATMLAMLTAMEEQKKVFPHGTISIRKGMPSVIITDETKLPDEYIRVKREPDKAALLADMKVGVVVEGAVLSNTPPSLTVKGT